ncbi:hypothetical protein F5876DRAFT_37385 [Lentinula aff. lateritia]|uniref:Uncharacterized protein n=1 Tax=Lentinula aff. lateritia TaxID=2804960 RepID=A0ACC1U5S7_9AGAR|nr:hypothetical protein F5876DRAFT_37385 [Lentinula aff. lateritia]
MVDHKPLPEPPSTSKTPNLTRLSIQARKHRERSIRFVLSELNDAWIDNNLEEWTRALEDALDDLASSMSQSRWLTGFKRNKAFKEKQPKKKRKLDEKVDLTENSDGSRRSAGGDEIFDNGLRKSDIQISSSNSERLERLRQIVAEPDVPSRTPKSRHLLLCLAPLGSRVALPNEDSGFNLVPSILGCSFRNDVFVLPEGGEEMDVILYGLHEWNTSVEQMSTHPVGGTFTLQGIPSLQQHRALSKALKLTVYVHLSLILEQQLLIDSHAHLTFAQPRVRVQAGSLQPSALPSLINNQNTPTNDAASSHKPRSLIPSGIFSFFTKRSPGRTSSPRDASSVRPSSDSVPFPSVEIVQPVRSSMDEMNAAARLRMFSFLSSSPPATEPQKGPTSTPFSDTLDRIEAQRDVLSSSPGVVFDPPILLVRLAEKEKAHREKEICLAGDEWVALNSLLGWGMNESWIKKGKGMTGICGFVNQQEISILVSSHVPLADSGTLNKDHDRDNDIDAPPEDSSRLCVDDRDQCLGKVITSWIDEADVPCDRLRAKRCEVQVGKHERRFVHGGVKISASIEWPASNVGEKDQTQDARVVTVWESCSICGAETKKNELSEGAYLFSFAKYLEVLIYSPLLCKLSPRLCEHTDPSSTTSSSTSSTRSISSNLPPQRFNIIRHFSASSEYTVSFKIDPVKDIFELRMPRLQISNRRVQEGDSDTLGFVSTLSHKGEMEHHASKEDEQKKKLRREIKAWWEGVADHMDLLEEKFCAEYQIAVRKALPRLPSTDEAYDSFDDDDFGEPEEYPTPKLKRSDDISQTASPIPAPSNPRSPLNHASSSSSSQLSTTPTASSASSVHSADAEGLNRDPMQLLSNLRQTFHRIEQTLYTQLAKTPASSLNEVRRAFLSAARGAERRLIAWQKKHFGEKKGKKKNKLNPSEKLRAVEPEWWNPTCHVAPGGNVIIREDDWGSIIAFTLSTTDYHRELASMSVVRPASDADPPNTPIAPSTSASSFFSAANVSGYQLFRTSALVQPDPDKEDVIWHEPEAYSAVICRKDHPRDPTSILSIREVLRQKSPDPNLLSASRFASLGSATSKKLNGGRGDRPSMLSNGLPPSAWAKPDVQVTKQEAEGEVASGMTHGRDEVHRMLLEFETIETEDTESRPNSSIVGSYNSGTLDASTVRPDLHAPHGAFVARNDAKTISQNSPSPSVTISVPNNIASPVSAKSSLDSFTNGLTNAMRFMLPTQIPRPLSAGSNRHHGLLTAAEVNAIDERPHIKYDWTIGKRLKFSCMVYYAKQFDSLRKRCGVDSIFLESLSRSANWSAEGGKSKSNFWKTADDRFIIKTLVNAWNVADLQVLIELSPSYFRYMDSTASKATVLAKLLGFYTIEIRNLETGTVQSKADLLVMENLFYDQKIDKTFDLKGIQGRKVKAGTNVTIQTSKTLFDGEWIEGQQQTLTLVRPHSKAVLREAIRSDAEFLSKSNIMDYSLLLGIDTEHKQIACGLVDTIGPYTFAKTLEYKAKQGLNSGNGKEVTVIPPAEYQERFTNALEKYFLACPDKWSRPLDRRKVVSNPDLLPSVL